MSVPQSEYELFAMLESRAIIVRTGWQEKRYPRSRVPEEAAGRLEGRGKLSSTARAVRDGSFGCRLLTNTGLDCALTKTVTARLLI